MNTVHHYCFIDQSHVSKMFTLYAFISNPYPQLLATTNWFSSLEIFPFYVWHINRIMQYVAFNILLLLLRKRYVWFIHVIV